MTGGAFWDDAELARKTVDQVSALKSIVVPFRKVEALVADFTTLAELIE